MQTEIERILAAALDRCETCDEPNAAYTQGVLECAGLIANAFVLEHHRHHRPVVGHLFSIGVRDNVRVRGYAIVSRPVARHLDDGQTVEITRVVTDGSRNACSKLYGAVRRAVRQRNRELGQAVQRIITYTLAGEEDGASLRASGFKVDRVSAGGTWSRPSRHRQDTHPLSGKIRWVSVVE